MTTSKRKRPTKAFGWHLSDDIAVVDGVTEGPDTFHLDAPGKRTPWHGLTPEEAYRKGVEDGREYQRLQEQRRRELDNPKERPRMDSSSYPTIASARLHKRA